MKTINVKVRISGGLAPVSIKVEIKNIDTDEIVKWKDKESFSKDFELESGRYTIQMFGVNAIEGKTEIEVSGEFSKGPLHNAKRMTTKPFITELFYFEF